MNKEGQSRGYRFNWTGVVLLFVSVSVSVSVSASASAGDGRGTVERAGVGESEQSSLGAACDTPHGRRFDFWPGVWQVESRQRSADGEWHETTNTWSAERVLDGCAYLDFTHGDYGSGEMKGMGSRFYDPAADRWTITWLSTLAPGRLGTWTGRFEGDRGDFYQSGEDGTRRSRISWFELREDSVRWSFAVSPDGGATWQVVWEMTFRRPTGL